jgi:hypothetical protein
MRAAAVSGMPAGHMMMRPDAIEDSKRMLVLDTERILAHNEINKTSVRLRRAPCRDRMPSGNTSLSTVILPGLAKSGHLA